jgi:dUTP pyrophosphatase
MVVENDKCIPKVGSERAAGMDLRANVKSALGFLVLEKNEAVQFGTGVRVQIPEGWVGLVMPRSGLGFKYEVKLVNTTGVIDSDYTGEIQVKIRNGNEKEMVIEDFSRICQMVIVPHYKLYDNIEIVDELISTERGEKGFGSTGTK